MCLLRLRILRTGSKQMKGRYASLSVHSQARVAFPCERQRLHIASIRNIAPPEHDSWKAYESEDLYIFSIPPVWIPPLSRVGRAEGRAIPQRGHRATSSRERQSYALMSHHH